MSAPPHRARVEDVHELASGMPYVTVEHGPRGNPVYQAGGKSFVFFRTPRPDACDPETGERYTDVIMFWVASESDKQSLIQVLLRSSRIGELTRQELAEIVQDAWLSRASNRRRATWLKAHQAAGTYGGLLAAGALANARHRESCDGQPTTDQEEQP